MSYRIRYEEKKISLGRCFAAGTVFGAAAWAAVTLAPVWTRAAAGEGLYDALARFVGGMILGPR